MSMLLIQNTGEVDINALLLVGASTKEGDNTKIGFFGSGNKYAIACLLRNNISFIIYAGLKRIEVTTQPVTMRDQAFDQVFIDGQGTSLTTRMGPQWTVWMALREFACNAIDEGGYAISSVENEDPEEGVTKTYINMMPEVEDFYINRWKYLEIEPALMTVKIDDNEVVHFHEHKPNQTKRIIYRKGVRCSPLEEAKNSLYRYDLPGIEIGENRIFESEWNLTRKICYAYYACSDVDVIKKLLSVITNKAYFEGDISHWPYGNETMDPAWAVVLIDEKIISAGFVPFMPPEDVILGKVVPDGLYQALKENFKELTFVDEPSHFKELQGTTVQLEALSLAIAEVESFGFDTSACTWKLVSFKEEGTVAQYHKSEVLISLDWLKKESHDFMVAVILEEMFHHAGYKNGSRLYEQHLCTELVKTYRIMLASKKQEAELTTLRALKNALMVIGEVFK